MEDQGILLCWDVDVWHVHQEQQRIKEAQRDSQVSWHVFEIQQKVRVDFFAKDEDASCSDGRIGKELKPVCEESGFEESIC